MILKVIVIIIYKCVLMIFVNLKINIIIKIISSNKEEKNKYFKILGINITL